MKQSLLHSSSISGSTLLAATLLAGLAAGCGGEPPPEGGPVRDIPGVVLLDTGDDGNNTPLEDPESPAGFNSYGFWYTYDDFQACEADGEPNPDTMTVLNPPQGAMFSTTPYSALTGVTPPQETLPNAPNNTHAIRFTGSSHEYFGAGLGFKFDGAYLAGNPGISFQAGGYTGIRFWVYSPIEMDFIVKLQDAYSTPEVGLCVPRGAFPGCLGPQNCENAPSTEGSENIAVGPMWRLYELYFAAVTDDPATPAIERGPFLRANWDGEDVMGNPMKDILPTPDRIYQLQFQTAAAENEGQIDLILDNVGFIVANGPEDNALGVFTPPAPAAP